jgi:transcriptional regulator with PAS, ATPase and Fis domain
MKMRTQLENLVDEMLDGQILLSEAAEEFEKLFIKKAFERNKRHISKTAAVIGIHRNTLSKRIAQYDK